MGDRGDRAQKLNAAHSLILFAESEPSLGLNHRKKNYHKDDCPLSFFPEFLFL
jgi:hypothetical protein